MSKFVGFSSPSDQAANDFASLHDLLDAA